MRITAEKKMTKARTNLILNHPFFGTLALRLVIREDDTCPTGWTDGKYLAYNPKWLDSLSFDETLGFVCHEVMHCAMGHQVRRDDRNPLGWNIAADYAINYLIDQAGMVLPPQALRKPEYDNRNAEWIYARLPKGQKGGDGGGGDGPGEPGNTDVGGCGEVRDASDKDGKKLGGSEREKEAAQWKVAVSQAAKAAKMAGKLPAGMERLIHDILEPTVNWRDALQRFANRNAKGNYSWIRPNRRFVWQNIYFPSLHSEELGDIVVAIDTSGSVTDAELSLIPGELTDILTRYPGTKITVIWCDYSIPKDGIQEFTVEDLPLQLKPKGGGGTSFIPPFKYVEENGLRPVAFVYITDGCCYEYPEQPQYPVLWIGTEKFEPPWGEFVLMNRPDTSRS
ncbi:MAG: vWA domain-containing protein [bacterium]